MTARDVPLPEPGHGQAPLEEENRALRRCIRDLLAISALPAVRRSNDAAQIMKSVAETLVSILDLDFIFIRAAAFQEKAPEERVLTGTNPESQDLKRSLSEIIPPLLKSKLELTPFLVPPFLKEASPFRAVTIPIQLLFPETGPGEEDCLVAASLRPNFPKECELVLLRTAANKASVMLERARLIAREQELREQFISTLSHDLRTPLTTAKLSAEMIAENPADVVACRSKSQRIIRQMDRMEKMIQNMLDVSLIQAGQAFPLAPSCFDLRALVLGTIEDLSAVHGNRFIVHADQSVPGCWDAGGLRRSLENVVTNALKYGLKETPVTLNLKAAESEVFLTVHNQGEPIPPEAQENLFRPFLRFAPHDSSPQRGWGLGLALVRGIVEAHGGRVSVQSDPGEGTSFIIQLPMSPTPLA